MPVKFVGIDPQTEGGDSPTVWIDTAAEEMLIQGWTATPEEEARAYREGGTAPDHAPGVPPHESIIRVPARMVDIIRKACDDLERSTDR
jgi:hypothetical protein